MKKRSGPSPASQGMGEGWAAVSTLIGGFAFWGGLGWLLDHWLGTRFLTPIGVILGMALGIYAVVMRFGRAPLPTEASKEHSTEHSTELSSGHSTERSTDRPDHRVPTGQS